MDHRQPFRGSQVRRELAWTWADLRGPAVLRLFRDVYVFAGVEVDVVMRARAALVVHPTGVIGGVAAAAAWGSAYTTTEADVEVHLGASGGRAQPGLHVRRERLRGDERTVVDGLPVTTPARTALDLARRLPVVEAVAAIDALIRVTMLRVEDIRVAAAEHSGARDLRAVERVLSLVDPRSSTPMWSRVRVALALRGLVCPAVAYWLVDDGGEPTARLELAWPDVRYAITAEQKGPPVAAPVLHGWTVLRIDPGLVVERADALATTAVWGLRAARRRSR